MDDTPARILVIENNLLIQNIYRRMLQEFPITAVTSGEDALVEIRTNGTDIIFSDHELAGKIRGADIYRHVREHHPHLARRFLFVTGSRAEVRALVGNEVPLLEKPFTCSALADKIHELMTVDE